MGRTLFFEHYRLATGYDGSPLEIGRSGAAITCKATDVRSGAPVALTLLPVDRIAPDQRENFEARARAALLLDHMNIVRPVEFGREGENFAFISEYPQGDTLESWVTENGPMPPDAMIRVALQIVSALGTASFHRIHHCGIEPSNVMIVSGQTAEGGWPLVKLMNYAVAGMTSGGDEVLTDGEFASPEQRHDGQVDFASEIYSLGATMWFLLAGAFSLVGRRSFPMRRLARPLRKVMAPMLRQNPEERPHDPMALALELRVCLRKVERRLALSRRFGIPFVPVTAQPKPARPRPLLAGVFEKPVAPPPDDKVAERRPRIWLRRGLTAAALLVAAATVAAMLLPAPVSLLLRQSQETRRVGVPPEVAQNSSATAAQDSDATLPENNPGQATGGAPHAALSVASAPVIASAGSSQDAASPPGRDADVSNSTVAPPPPATGPETVWERAAGPSAHPRIAQENQAASTETGDEQSADGVASSPNDIKNEPSPGPRVTARPRVSNSRTTSASKLTTRRAPSSYSRNDQRYTRATPGTTRRAVHPPVYGRSASARVAAIAPDGSVVLRFASGRTAVLPPPPYYLPERYRVRKHRVIIGRRPWFLPPPPYALLHPPGFNPGD